MLLAVDIGNSEIKSGIWDGEKWIKQLRYETYPVLAGGDYQPIFEKMFEQENIDVSQIEYTAIASVVPPASGPITNALSNMAGVKPLVINAALDTGIKVRAEYAEKVGADLIAGAVAAYHLAKEACIVVDCGTATTLMAVESSGGFLGGAICAGLKTSVNALIGGAAQLQEIPLEIPSSSVGKNPIQTMQSGLVGGHLSMIEGLIDKMKDEIGPARVVATGGLIAALANHTDYFDFVEPTLVLDGIRLIAERQLAKQM